MNDSLMDNFDRISMSSVFDDSLLAPMILRSQSIVFFQDDFVDLIFFEVHLWPIATMSTMWMMMEVVIIDRNVPNDSIQSDDCFVMFCFDY